ncbi:MAG: hypothetical protein A3A98_00830 [Candidatus Staskawiczbacteria bacterium RIFCSPLOWO2_01_FULL_40_39]|uniref:N-acetyltransferase domain-containing protein n=1 Tax=Candidatus Staskawiczbacteria bacterium RIFCSPHIGHO2_01_FULL_39_25 TaxID=1802202 RepID=A0A1G2HMT7_9BACT|nr:MAG: hypothetical protein A2730_00830 [Candidatus Staskawiczbacteria bacterium RIFCSPHIGHO2_01_FULL_39_25]OGZ73275.1 MAG: hypothetical protein A3A98_00830 [Candidatus Staskawiczbacteria bacterium RIFCSPLOWO2_01_FULL_40_39]OGZ75088.1 MAG: hypothetical protein A3I87_02745 [Candidatus Staskawiczbacteria bacterium RIFCSPLOWO2_02_FULL_39_8]
MEITSEIKKDAYAVKFTAMENGKTAGWAYLYLIFQDRHEEPYGLMENVYVESEFRSKGIGTQLVKLVIEEAKKRNCYKLIGNSNLDNTRAQALYERLGFRKYGIELRMDIKESKIKQKD